MAGKQISLVTATLIAAFSWNASDSVAQAQNQLYPRPAQEQSAGYTSQLSDQQPAGEHVAAPYTSVDASADAGCGCGGYPTAGHRPLRGRGHSLFAQWQYNWNKFQADFNLHTARNAAWPQPFKCRDRSLYFQMMQTNIDAGWVRASTLTDLHFDPETNELNKAGESKVAWVMQAAPKHRRSIFVYQTDNDSIDSRIASVREVVNKWYGHLGEAEVAATHRWPQQSDGRYYQAVDERYLGALPDPVLNASVGGSIDDQ